VTLPGHAFLATSPLLLSRSKPEEQTSELLDAELRATLDPNDPALLRISVATSEGEVEVASCSCFSPSREFRPLAAAIAEQWLVRSQQGWAPETWRLVDYLNTYPPKIVLASGDVVEGNRSWVLQSAGLTIPREILIKWDWSGVSTSLEVGEAPHGLLNVHQATVRNISTSWPQGSLILCDHGKGEIADFIAIAPIPSPQGPLRVCLFHCKAAGGPPSIREGDISEVAAQVIKSQQWQLHPDLLSEMLKRHERGRLTIEQGDLDGLQAVTHGRPHLLGFQVSIVQPGLSVDDLPQAAGDPRLAILASCYAWCQDTGVDMSIIGA
jgi:hypothetical protein